MSDLCMYELEDIVWDEFGQNDDHIVPHPSDEDANGHEFQRDDRKKQRRESIGISSDAVDQHAYELVRNEGTELATLNKKRRNTMLEKESWSQASGGVFSASCDSESIKEVTSVASDDARLPNECFKSSNIDSISGEFCADDPILGDRCTTADGSSYSYPLNHISQTDNDLSFLDTDCEDKESSDLLYYGWPDIGNFEDVDRIFRNCDSSFGLDNADNEDGLGWFSLSNAIQGSEDALKSDFKFPCPESNTLKNVTEDHDLSGLSNGSFAINGSSMKCASVSYECCSGPLKTDEPPEVSELSFMRLNQISEGKDEFMHKDQINLHRNQPKHQNQTEGKRKGRCLESGGIQRQKQNLAADSLVYLQTDVPYIDSHYFQPSDQTTVSPTLSGTRSQNNGVKSLSPKESSYSSSQGHSVESTCNLSMVETAVTIDDRRENLCHGQGFQPTSTGSRKNADLISKSVSARKQLHHSHNEYENHSNVGGVSIEVPTELGSSNVQESSSMNSGFNEISLEATSFRQLQQVMEKLDLRTKLCIRDSLYRLARSAEQRHNNANLHGSSGYDRDACGALMAEGTNKCTGFMDMETDTNPIDRSIAHLLFHRPSDPSAMTTNNPMSLEPQKVISGAISSPPQIADKIVRSEETAGETEEKVAGG